MVPKVRRWTLSGPEKLQPRPSTMPITTRPDSILLQHGAASAEIALKGATVFSFVVNGIEHLFLSSKSDIKQSDPAAIRGGIPICWPVFGPPPKDNPLYANLKQHGFARTNIWSFSSEDSGPDDDGLGEKAVFHLKSTPETLKLFALPFLVIYTVHVRSSQLIVTLKVSSPPTASAPLPFQALLHSYLRLPAAVKPAQVQVTPLEGLKFVDKVMGGTEGREERSVVEVQGPKGEVDRVYYAAPDTFKIGYQGQKGGMEVTKEGLADVVLWNPGQEKGATIGDMEEGGADRYVCLEPGQVGSFVSLAPGGEWQGSVTLAFFD